MAKGSIAAQTKVRDRSDLNPLCKLCTHCLFAYHLILTTHADSMFSYNTNRQSINFLSHWVTEILFFALAEYFLQRNG